MVSLLSDSTHPVVLVSDAPAVVHKTYPHRSSFASPAYTCRYSQKLWTIWTHWLLPERAPLLLAKLWRTLAKRPSYIG